MLTNKKEIPDSIHFYYMKDNHTFVKLEGKSLLDITNRADEVEILHPYGMLCPAILCKEGKEVRRVGTYVHSHGPKARLDWIQNKLEWREVLKADKDVARLMGFETKNMTNKTHEDDYIETYSGKKVFILNPTVDSISILDIAHALSNICRYTGHCQRYYSVAEHSVHVANLCGANPLWGLLHDASEAYLMDIASPIKPHLANYKELERNLMRVVCKRFGLTEEMPQDVKHADLIALYLEAGKLMKSGGRNWSCFKNLNINKSDYEEIEKQIVGWSPEVAKQKFIETFLELTENKII